MTDAERLDLLAMLLARKRAETMGRAPATPINFETLLAIATAPAEILDQIVSDAPALTTFLIQRPRTALWTDYERDVIRSQFTPWAWPRWLNDSVCQ